MKKRWCNWTREVLGVGGVEDVLEVDLENKNGSSCCHLFFFCVVFRCFVFLSLQLREDLGGSAFVEGLEVIKVVDLAVGTSRLVVEVVGALEVGLPQLDELWVAGFLGLLSDLAHIVGHLCSLFLVAVVFAVVACLCVAWPKKKKKKKKN